MSGARAHESRERNGRGGAPPAISLSRVHGARNGAGRRCEAAVSLSCRDRAGVWVDNGPQRRVSRLLDGRSRTCEREGAGGARPRGAVGRRARLHWMCTNSYNCGGERGLECEGRGRGTKSVSLRGRGERGERFKRACKRQLAGRGGGRWDRSGDEGADGDEADGRNGLWQRRRRTTCDVGGGGQDGGGRRRRRAA